MVYVDGQHLALVDVVDPVVVLVVQAREVTLVDRHLVGTAALADLVDQRGHARTQVYEQVGARNQVCRHLEDAHVGIEVARRHESHLVQICRKDMRILVDRPVLEQVAAVVQNLDRLVDAGPQKVDLQVERPSAHVFVEVADARVAALFVVGGGVNGTECMPIFKIDNIRAVPNR